MLCLFALELDIDINTLNVKALSYFWKDTRLGKGACYSLDILSAYTLQHLHLFLPSGTSEVLFLSPMSDSYWIDNLMGDPHNLL